MNMKLEEEKRKKRFMEARGGSVGEGYTKVNGEWIKDTKRDMIDLSLNRSLPELESSYWEFIEATEGEDSSGWSSSVQEDISALEGYLMKMDIL